MNVYRHNKNGCLYRIYRGRQLQLVVEPLLESSPKLNLVLKATKDTHYVGITSFTLAYTE